MTAPGPQLKGRIYVLGGHSLTGWNPALGAAATPPAGPPLLPSCDAGAGACQLDQSLNDVWVTDGQARRRRGGWGGRGGRRGVRMGGGGGGG